MPITPAAVAPILARTLSQSSVKLTGQSTASAAMKNFKQPFNTLISPTTQTSNGSVDNAGHVQIKTSESERQRFPGMPTYIGLSPVAKEDRTFESSQKVEGELSDGTRFLVKAYTTNARPLHDDKPIDESLKSTIVIPHGEMSDAEGKALLDHLKNEADRGSGVYGTIDNNCVDSWTKTMETVTGKEIDTPPFARPQDVEQKARQIKLGSQESDSGNPA